MRSLRTTFLFLTSLPPRGGPRERGQERLCSTSKQAAGGTNPETHWGKTRNPPGPGKTRPGSRFSPRPPFLPPRHDRPHRANDRGRIKHDGHAAPVPANSAGTIPSQKRRKGDSPGRTTRPAAGPGPGWVPSRTARPPSSPPRPSPRRTWGTSAVLADHQVTIRASLTEDTPRTIAALLADPRTDDDTWHGTPSPTSNTPAPATVSQLGQGTPVAQTLRGSRILSVDGTRVAGGEGVVGPRGRLQAAWTRGSRVNACGPNGPAAYSSGVSQRTPIGGTVIRADAGRPCQGSGSASTPPRLPTPLPPYTIASVLMTSRQRPAAGRPTR